MKKNRQVFLFGAGATLGWDSPTTWELTELIRKAGFKTTDNKTTITEFIYQKLINHGYSEKVVNFETIINVIEELIVYYSQFDSSRKTPSLLKCFFDSKYEDELFNFSIKGGVVRHGYELQIPAGADYLLSKPAYNNETPEQLFLQHLLSELLTAINARISKYAYHAYSHTVLDTSSEMSKLFSNWMAANAKNSILRLYTLNYERIFKVLMQQAGISTFEGFDCEEFIGYESDLRANVLKILGDSECHVHYNLHGSAFWEVYDLDKDQLPNPEIVLTAAPNLPCNNHPATIQMEKGKTLLVTNIVTGYQKAQKAMITPFKQMQFSFDRDCCFADEVYVIGYSFGDEHINESIKTAIRHNPNLKVVIVDPSFIKNDLEYHFALKFFPFKKDGIESLKPKKVSDNEYQYFGGAFTAYTLDFKEYLEQVKTKKRVTSQP